MNDRRHLNLNLTEVDNTDGYPYKRQVSASSADGSIRVFFDDLETRLIEQINRADVVIGCVAWLTNGAILDALARKKGVSLIVQKEDFLRPDMAQRPEWTAYLRDKYNRLPATLDRVYDFEGLTPLFQLLCQLGDYSLEAVRCVGNYNRDKKPAFPRAHHKFVVFCKSQTARIEAVPTFREIETETGFSFEQTGERNVSIKALKPYAVWTGSFNFTENATASLENALLISDPAIVRAYVDEYAHVMALSEELDWTADWVAPDYRIGT